MRTITLHKTDIILNKDKLNNILKVKELDHTELHDRMVKKFGIDLKYKGFMHLCSNRSSWKLLYAYAVCNILEISLDDIFDIVEVDIEKKLRERKEWQEKYEHRKKKKKNIVE